MWELLQDLKQGNDKVKEVSVEKLSLGLGKGLAWGRGLGLGISG